MLGLLEGDTMILSTKFSVINTIILLLIAAACFMFGYMIGQIQAENACVETLIDYNTQLEGTGDI